MWLIGMMGSGKTTVARQAASRLAVPFFDTDEMVVEMANMPVAAIWGDLGEEGFRELERRAVAAVPDSGFVAAAGGGAVLDQANRRHMALGKPVVWLRAKPDLLASRLEGDVTRPLLEGDAPATVRLGEILERRTQVYASLATDIVETDGREIESVVDDVIGIWES